MCELTVTSIITITTKRSFLKVFQISLFLVLIDVESHHRVFMSNVTHFPFVPLDPPTRVQQTTSRTHQKIYLKKNLIIQQAQPF